MKTKTSRYNIARRVLIFWTLFIGIGAVAGGLSMIIDPSGKALGMDGMLPYFTALPFADVLFKDFLFPGFALLMEFQTQRLKLGFSSSSLSIPITLISFAHERILPE